MSCLLITGGYDCTLRLWRPDNGTCIRTLNFQDSQANCLAVSPDRKMIAAGGHTVIRFYDPRSAAVLPYSNFEGHANNVTTLGFSRDGAWMYSGSEDHTLKIWDVRASAERQQEFTIGHPVITASLHPNQQELFVGDQEGQILRWDMRTYRCAEVLIPSPGTPIQSLAISPDGQFVVALTNLGQCYVWRLASGEMVPMHILDAHPLAYGTKCKFSPDGSKLVTTSSDKTAHLYDVRSDFQSVCKLTGHTGWVWDCAFSADSQFVVTVSSDKSGRLWDSQGRPALEFKGHQRTVSCVALHDI